MSATCIYGSNEEVRKQKAADLLELYFLRLNSPNTLVIQAEEGKKNIGIDQVRTIKGFLYTDPQGSTHKAVVILNAQLLTVQAQNALLKVLEEPPTYGILILTSKSYSSLLPTVMSRCKQIRLNTQIVNQTEVTFNEIISVPVGERFLYVEKLSQMEKEELISTFEGWVYQIRGDMLKEISYNPKLAIESIMKAKSDIENTNINGKMVLEWLFITLS